MKFDDIASAIGAQIIISPPSKNDRIKRIYAGDRISDLLNQASGSTMLVTNAASNQLLRVAELMDVPAICLLNGSAFDSSLLERAQKNGIGLMVSAKGMFETCGQLYVCLGFSKEPR